MPDAWTDPVILAGNVEVLGIIQETAEVVQVAGVRDQDHGTDAGDRVQDHTMTEDGDDPQKDEVLVADAEVAVHPYVTEIQGHQTEIDHGRHVERSARDEKANEKKNEKGQEVQKAKQTERKNERLVQNRAVSHTVVQEAERVVKLGPSMKTGTHLLSLYQVRSRKLHPPKMPNDPSHDRMMQVKYLSALTVVGKNMKLI